MSAKFEAGRAAGAKAFADGRMAVPALDPAVGVLLKGCSTKETLSVLRGWTRGWHTANVAAPVEG